MLRKCWWTRRALNNAKKTLGDNEKMLGSIEEILRISSIIEKILKDIKMLGKC